MSLAVAHAGDNYDVVVYGGTSAGVIAAAQAARMGKAVVVIETSHRIGGMTSGGLGSIDTGNKKAIGGLALDFFQRVGSQYGKQQPAWALEPSVALKVYQYYIETNRIPVVYNERLDLKTGVAKKGVAITSIKMESERVFQGKEFIDATYEGDLMAKAGVSYTIGRESNATYGETLNGIRPAGDQWLPKIDPYTIPGDQSSALLPGFNPDAGGSPGDGDKKVMAYNFRLCMTTQPNNRVMIEKPAGYKETDYKIFFRAAEHGMTNFLRINGLPNGKADINNSGARPGGVSTDYIGMSADYPDADYQTREKIYRAQRIYEQGFIWTLQNHPRTPPKIRELYKEWGLAKDEFNDSDNWPTQLYIREARRMVSDYVITQKIVLREVATDRPIALGSYAMDSHQCQYCIGPDGFVRPEGGMFVAVKVPFGIDYGAIVPKATECTNLLVPVCVSASHAASGTIRMEPVYMGLGQSAATAACLAIDQNQSVQDVPYDALRAHLLADKQILEAR